MVRQTEGISESILSKFNPEIKMFTPKWERVGADSPERCQHIIPQSGQCSNKVVESSKYCPAHGGNRGFQSAEKAGLRNYRLSKYKVRIQELGNSDAILSLRDEIGILRILIEEKINQCSGEGELLLMSGPLTDLIMKVDKIVTSCHRLEAKLGNLLDRSKVLQFAQTVVAIVSKYVTEDELEKVAAEISNSLEQS